MFGVGNSENRQKDPAPEPQHCCGTNQALLYAEQCAKVLPDVAGPLPPASCPVLVKSSLLHGVSDTRIAAGDTQRSQYLPFPELATGEEAT